MGSWPDSRVVKRRNVFGTDDKWQRALEQRMQSQKGSGTDLAGAFQLFIQKIFLYSFRKLQENL